jgi:glycosyltransferase involved in cell wall biosynthesis
MNIVKISGHACIRVQKMALPLIEKGHNVHLIAQKMPMFFEEYNTFTHAAGVKNYVEAVKIFAETADIFHVHNEPSWFVTLVKEHTDKPVIIDVHDSWLARTTEEEEKELRAKGKNVSRVYSEERNNFQLADGLVFPSKSFADIVRSTFKLEQPYRILPSYLPRRFYRYNGDQYMGGLVYEGRVDLKEDIEKDDKLHGFRYCDYEKLAKATHKMGMDFHIYTTRNDDKFKAVYEDISFRHEPRHLEELLKSLTRHDWGLVGNVFHTPEWEVAFPNKLFEYMAAGVPIVAINAKECGKFVKKHKIGIEVKSLEELGKRWAEHRECRKNLVKVRQKFSMDANIHELESLYKEVLSGGN